MITPSNQLPAAQRTVVLRRMLTLRAAAGRTLRPSSLLAPGNEAILIGVLAVLGPLDTVIATSRPPALAGRTRDCGADTAVTVALGTSAGRQRFGSISALVSGRRRVPPIEAIIVDAWDVEAVLLTAARSASSVRGRPSALLIRMRGSTPPIDRDPIAILAGRMYAERQLDHGGFRAIAAGHRTPASRQQIHGCAVCRSTGSDRADEIRACAQHFTGVLIGGPAAPTRPSTPRRSASGTSRPLPASPR